jgi:NAD(P)-dependent dehydrogenase (short-subunit alcohol dehydrogenase family)
MQTGRKFSSPFPSAVGYDFLTMGRLEERAAIITGGASGIGEATVRAFVREGARVVIADLQNERGEALAAELGDAALFQRTDVSSEDDVRGAVECCVREYGQVDVMFNNAGFVGGPGPIAQIPVEEFDRTLGVLLRGVFLGMKHAAAVMQPRGIGSIISTASIAGIAGGTGTHVYAAAKAAVIQLTRSVALEMAPDGVRVNCIAPGGVATPLTQTFGDQSVPIDVVQKALVSYQPLRRAGLPEDIANAALWLASDEASFVTGHTLVVDGGYTAGTPWHKQSSTLTQRPPS